MAWREEYVLDHHQRGERQRLALMSRLLDPMHRRHIEQLGVARRARGRWKWAAATGPCRPGWPGRWRRAGRRWRWISTCRWPARTRPGWSTGRVTSWPGRSGRAASTWSPRGPCCTMWATRPPRWPTWWPAPGRAGRSCSSSRTSCRSAWPSPRTSGRSGRAGWPGPGAGHRLLHRPQAARHAGRPGLAGVTATAETALYYGGSPWAEYWRETVTELRGRLLASGRLDGRLIDAFLDQCQEPSWWTQTIAFTAVAGHSPGPAKR